VPIPGVVEIKKYEYPNTLKSVKRATQGFLCRKNGGSFLELQKITY